LISAFFSFLFTAQMMMLFMTKSALVLLLAATSSSEVVATITTEQRELYNAWCSQFGDASTIDQGCNASNPVCVGEFGELLAASNDGDYCAACINTQADDSVADMGCSGANLRCAYDHDDSNPPLNGNGNKCMPDVTRDPCVRFPAANNIDEGCNVTNPVCVGYGGKMLAASNKAGEDGYCAVCFNTQQANWVADWGCTAAQPKCVNYWNEEPDLNWAGLECVAALEPSQVCAAQGNAFISSTTVDLGLEQKYDVVDDLPDVPVGLAVDGAQDLYVISRWGGTVYKYDTAGQLQASIPTPITHTDLVDIQVVRNGITLGGTNIRAKCLLIAAAEFVVGVGYSNTVDVYALHMETGKVLAEIHVDIGDAAAGVAFHASQDKLFFVGYNNNLLVKVDPQDASIIQQVDMLEAFDYEMLGGDIAVDPVTCNLYVVSGGDKEQQVLELTPDMTLVRRMNYPTEITTSAARFASGMAIECGSMWLLHWFDADSSAAVYRASGPFGVEPWCS
jgi:hypothetical protein